MMKDNLLFFLDSLLQARVNLAILSSVSIPLISLVLKPRHSQLDGAS